jgi:hypothetical protein
MPTLDTSADVLAALAQQGAPATAVAAIEDFFTRQARVRRERYSAEREREELAQVTAETLASLEAAAAAAETAIDAERDAALETLEAERTKRSVERHELRDVVDTQRLRESDDVGELLSLVADADRHGEHVGQAARTIALGRIKVLAADEQRRNVLGGKAFNALCALSQQAGRGVDAASVRQRFEQKKKAARRLVGQVAAVADLAGSLVRAARQSAVPAPAPASRGRLIVGSYWENRQAAAKK